MKILFVSFHCLDGTAEGLAAARVAGALARRGHDVHLLASNRVAVEVAGVTVHRLAPLPPGAFDRLGQALDRRSSRGWPWSRLSAVPNLIRGGSVEERGWAEAVARKAAEIHREGGVDVLHSRLNPAASHRAALAVLRRVPSLPWCAYFSDPWPHHLYPEPYRFTVGPWSRRRLEGLLDTFLSRADSLVFPSDRLQDHLLRGERERFRSKVSIVPHIGEDHVPRPEPRPERNGALKLRHAGFLMKERRIEPLLEGLERFLAVKPEARGSVRLEFAGRYAGGELPRVPAALDGVVAFQPSMPPDAARAWMAGADVSLLVEACLREGIFFPSKLSDYLTGGRPILALSPRQGVAADLLTGGGGLLAGPEAPAEIAAALERLHDLWRAGRLDELAPTPEQAAAVSADRVASLYERAFEEAKR